MKPLWTGNSTSNFLLLLQWSVICVSFRYDHRFRSLCSSGEPAQTQCAGTSQRSGCLILHVCLWSSQQSWRCDYWSVVKMQEQMNSSPSWRSVVSVQEVQTETLEQNERDQVNGNRERERGNNDNRWIWSNNTVVLRLKLIRNKTKQAFQIS